MKIDHHELVLEVRRRVEDVHKTSEQKTFELRAPDERGLLVSEG